MGTVSKSFNRHCTNGNWDIQVSQHRIQIPSTSVGTWHVTSLQSPAQTSKSFSQVVYHSKWTFSGSWVFGSLCSTMKSYFACILDHYTCIITFNPKIALLLLAVLFLGFLSVYSLCCKKKGIGLPPIQLAKIIWREVRWAETKFKVFLSYMRTKLRIVGQNQKQIPCINQKQWKQIIYERRQCPDCSDSPSCLLKCFFSAMPRV